MRGNEGFVGAKRSRCLHGRHTKAERIGSYRVYLKDAEITDLSVEGTSAEELVVSLYKEFDI